jgi:biotin carboxyl carrier protein
MQFFKVTVNGKTYEVSVEEISQGNPGFAPAQSEAPVVSTPSATAPAPQAQSQNIAAGEESVPAPLGGTIMDVKVKPGEQVKKGQVLLTLEALKMENEIVAPAAGTVGQVFVQAGASVNTGDALLTLRF